MSCSALDRSSLIARRFGARAETYHEHAQLQRLAARELARFVDACGGLPERGLVAEVGCGTGLLTELLAPRAEQYLATDIAPEMLKACQARLTGMGHIRYDCRDGETAPFPETPLALVSNLAAQWFRDPVGGLVRLSTLAPVFAFSLPLAGSFPEWEAAFHDMGRTSGLLPLPEEDAVRRALTCLPGCTTQFQTLRHVIRYPNAKHFADSFRAIGAHTTRPGYRPAPIRPVLRRFATGMEATAIVLYAVVKKDTA